MDKEIVDSLLYRPLKNGRNYNKFFTSSDCKPTKLKSGNTFVTMDLIKNAINKYYKQCKSIAPTLKKQTLKATSNSIYSFLYNHIQYNKDLQDQLLRSPNCSWSDRVSGIDCKSYAIFSGCILKALNIGFLIRKINQTDTSKNNYSHVYIIVPKDQKTLSVSGASSYYVIDATTHNNNEP